MMIQAFYTGMSGLKASSQAIDVISDNLSNISTVGFRGYNSEFTNMFEEALNTVSSSSSVDSSIGAGTQVGTVAMDESQGVFQLTNKSTDLAILGDGWFGIQADDEPLYTRDGSFTFDANRDLVTHDGYHLLGTMGNNTADGVLTQQLSSIAIGDVSSQEALNFPKELYFPPVATTQALFSGNIDLDEEIVSVGVPVITASGTVNNLRLEYTKVNPQVSPGVQWNVLASTQSKDGEITYSTESGVVSFDESGLLISNTLSSIDNQGSSVAIDLGSGYDGVISMSAPSSLFGSADGLEDGELLGYDINKNGEVIATFTNGRQSNVATISVFHFANDRGLERMSGSRFAQSSNSGEALFFQDANGNNILGTDLATNQLEGSNVKIEVGLTDLIIMQRSYDANSKSITTADEMLQKALNMSG